MSPRGIQVFVNSNGQLGTFTSSRRYKKDIHDLGNLSHKLMALRTVSFRYKQAAEDGTHPLQYGLIAEEVAQIAPELVAYDRTGKPYSVNYHRLTPLLLKELQQQRYTRLRVWGPSPVFLSELPSTTMATLPAARATAATSPAFSITQISPKQEVGGNSSLCHGKRPYL